MGEIVRLDAFYKSKYRAAVLEEFEANCAAHENQDLSLVEILSREAWAATQAVNVAFGRWLTVLDSKPAELVERITEVMATLQAEDEAVRDGEA